METLCLGLLLSGLRIQKRRLRFGVRNCPALTNVAAGLSSNLLLGNLAYVAQDIRRKHQVGTEGYSWTAGPSHGDTASGAGTISIWVGYQIPVAIVHEWQATKVANF